MASYGCGIMTINLEADIHSAWIRAHSLLAKERPDPNEVAEVIADLRKCVEQVRDKDAPGERELWWLIKRLAGLNSSMHRPTYLPR